MKGHSIVKGYKLGVQSRPSPSPRVTSSVAKNPKNLVRRAGEPNWYVRLAVPADVRKALGQSVLKKSLKTTSVVEAERRKGAFLTAWWAQIEEARKGRMPPEGWQDGVISLIGQIEAIRNHEKLKLLGMPTKQPFTYPTPDPEKLKIFAQNPVVQDMVREMRAKRKSGPMEALELENDLAAIAQDVLGMAIKQQYALSTDQKDELSKIIVDPTTRKSYSPVTPARIQTFHAYRVKMNIAPKTIDQQQAKLEKLSAFLVEQKSELDFDAVSAWLDSLSLSAKTLAQYLLAGSVFWRWALKHDNWWRENFKNRANPFENHDLPQISTKARRDGQRRDFKVADLEKLQRASIDSGLPVLGDLILLGAYSGARIEELCQLKAENVIHPDGIPSLDITDSKTAAGIRVVPLHPALLPVVNRLITNSEDGFLIPSASKNKYGIRSDALSKAFGRLKGAEGYGTQYVFHSIRKTVITQLVQADVAGTLIAELVGHETGTVTFDVYSQGASAKQKLAAISKLPTLKI